MRSGWPLLPWLVACTIKSEPTPTVQPDTPPPQAQTKTDAPQAKPKMAPDPTDAKDLGAEAPLEEGAVRWEGMVRPTKGGYDVRGVVLDDGVFVQKLQASSLDVLPSDPGWFLGAVVRVTGVLKKVSGEGSQDGGLAVQTRSGTWFVASQVSAVELIRHAQQIEGTMVRSKGMWSVDKYLVNHHDLEWALVSSGGGKAGTRVRIWGQPRVVRCDPREQCLIGGSLPVFDVARARVLP